MAKKVFLGVGHGGSDPGAIGNGFEEAYLNLAIAITCKDELVRHGVEVKMSRTKEEDDTLSEEIRECNAYNPDLAVDIHNNAGGGDGAEAYYYTGGGTSKVLAENILSEIVKIGQNSRGAKPNIISGIKEYFGFIRETKAPATIVECAFIDNKTDIKIIDTVAEQQAMGVAIAKGILKTLGIAYIATSTAYSKETQKNFRVNGINITRQADYLVLYMGEGTTKTNQWGTEVALDKDFKATATPVYGVGNMAIPKGGCVLSGHGKASTWLLENIKKGDKLNITAGK
jgi:N-acetylmuramoyl-L-alanine amidase